MRFLYPVFLIGALAAAIPIVLHFMRRHLAPEVPFSAVRLLRGSPVPQAERRRLRDLLLLAARILAILLLAAAFARPYLAGPASGSPGLRIVAIDRSFSMGAPGRFARALVEARGAIDQAPAGEPVAVVAFDDRAEVMAEPGSASDARTALARLAPGFGGTRYGPVFDKASELAGGAGGRLIVVTDLHTAGWGDRSRQILDAGLQLDVRDVGAALQNLAVAGLRAETDRVVASIRNTGRVSRSGQLRVERDGRIAATTPFTAAGGSITEVSIPYRAPESGALAVSLDDPQGFPADNTRFLILDAAIGDAVLIVATGAGQSGFYLTRALAAQSAAPGDRRAARVQVIDAGRTAEGKALSAADVSNHAAVVLLSTRGIERGARDAIGAFARAGGGILIAASPDVEPSVLASMFDLNTALSDVAERPGPLSLSITDLRHPVFRPFGALAANLGQVRFDRAWRIRPDDWDVAARFTDGTPALLERTEGKGRVVLFASDIDRSWNDFPVHSSFVPFVAEAVRYVSGRGERPRDYLVSSIPGGVPARPGVYNAGPDNRLVAVNVDGRESETSRVAPGEFAALVEQTPGRPIHRAQVEARQAEARQSYWQYGLLLMIGALVAESFVGRA
jgi:Aerotolerance regulator N-terminal/von Willebrand factor type A domain